MFINRQEVRFNPSKVPVPGFEPKGKHSFRAWLARARQILMGEIPTRMISTMTASTISGVKTFGEIAAALSPLIVSDVRVNEMTLQVSVPKDLSNRAAVEDALVDQGIDPDGVYFDYEKMYITTDMFDPPAFPHGIHFTTLAAGEEIDLSVKVDWCQARFDDRALCTPVANAGFHQEDNGDYILAYTVKEGADADTIYNEMIEMIQLYPPGTDLPKSRDEERVVAASSSTLNPKYFR